MAVSIDLKGADLKEIPQFVYERTDAQWLVLSNNNLRIVPKRLSSLQRLTRLALNDNNIISIELGLGKLTALSWMDLTRNRLRNLPKDISNCAKLSGLGLSENLFENIPECVYSLTSLRKFGCFSNRISLLSPAIGNLKRLVKMDLSNNRLEALPPQIGELKQLAWLNLSNNLLKNLPSSVSRLTALEELGLGVNRLESIPDLSLLKRLRVLPLFRNCLVDVPGIHGLLSLEKLDCSDNRLSHFLTEALNLPAIRYLNVRSNRITVLPNRPTKTRTLALLDIGENALKAVPAGFLRALGSSCVVRICGNPFQLEKPVFPIYNPNLAQMALSFLLNQKKVRKLFRIEMGNYIKYLCDICGKIFVTNPYISYTQAAFTPDEQFVIKNTLCTKKCFRKSTDRG